MEIVAVLSLRNEAAFLLDWLAHHRHLGISHVVALSNDCQDGTDAMLDRLQALGGLTHIRNDGPYAQQGIQFSGLKRADKSPAVRAADWLIALDIDEFVNVHVGDGRLPDLIAALPQATAIPLTWRLFGNAGIVQYEDRPVPQIFSRAAPEVLHWPWRTAMFKTLYRNDGCYRKLGVHRPRRPDPDRIGEARWVSTLGKDLGEDFRSRRIYSDYGRPLYGLAQLNHYALGAMESYLLKADRGRAVHSDQTLGMDYWVERNWCDVEDLSIRRYDRAVAQIRAQFAADPELARLHQQAVAWRHGRLKDLLAREPWRALMARLLMTPPTRAISQKRAAMLRNHALRGAPE